MSDSSKTSLIKFSGIDQHTENSPKSFTKALAKNEYVSGGFYNSDLNRILNNHSDALTRAFGDKIIAKMLRDPEVKKCETVLKISVLNDGVTIFPAVSKPAALKPASENETLEEKRERLAREKEIKRYELAEQYASFATRALKNIDGSFISVLEAMLDAIVYGNKVAEQTYEEKYDSDFGKTVFTLSSIRVKARDNIQFVVDKYNKVLGIYATIKIGNSTKQVILPREKFLILTFRGKDGDPRGTSILEAVYNAWNLKMQLWPEYLRWLLQCALPSVVGIASDKTDASVLRDAQGNIIRDENNNPLYESEVGKLLSALVQLRNSTAIAVPHGAEVKAISNQVSGDPFKGMRDALNEEIEMGMILQTLATSEGRNMSRAASQTHMSVLDLFVFFIKNLVIEMISNDILKPLMKLNFPDFDMSLLPKVSMGDTERRDWAKDAIAIATLYKSGFIGDSQKVGYDKILSAPERDIESDRLNAQQTQASNDKLSNVSTSELEEVKALAKEYDSLHGDNG